MIGVLRLGHRPDRDKRVTTHVALVARALGADKIFIATPDDELKERIESVVRRFGGKFEIETGTNWRSLIKNWKGCRVHLTMYGQRLSDALPSIPRDRPLLLIVGAEKVPKEVYHMADINVAVGNQPHSEVAALAVFLDRFLDGASPAYANGEALILPHHRGKTVVAKGEMPTRDGAIALLKAVGCDAGIIAHCEAVEELAVAIAKRCRADLKLVSAGALLHDIGRSRTHKIGHAVEGARLAKELGLPEKLVRIIERHIGAGLTAAEAKKLGLPPKDYIPKTLEEKIVAHADNLVGTAKSPSKRIPSEQATERLRRNGAAEGAKRLLALHKELSRRCGLDLDELE